MGTLNAVPDHNPFAFECSLHYGIFRTTRNALAPIPTHPMR